MKAQELRIGNYHLYHMEDEMDERKEWDEITTIDGQDIAYLEMNPDDPDYKPIPLTEEWLLKFGFSDKDCKEGYIEIVTGFTNFVLYKPDQEVNYDYYTWHFKQERYPKIVAVPYVHQLQNLYFVLTGDELQNSEHVT